MQSPVRSYLSFCLTVAIVLAYCAQMNGAALAEGLESQAKPANPVIDPAYTAKIKEFTTAPHFLTELVDHLPASATVPSPEKILGYAIGDPNHLTYSKDLHRYYRALAAASTRVKVFVAPEKSEEGKEQLLVLVSDEANLANLDRYKEITRKLADPRKITDEEAAQLVSQGKPFYWASGSIHSVETGSPEMLMEMAYRIAVEESPFIEAIRKNVIVMITPTLEVDGRDRMVDTYNYHKANPGKPMIPLLYWGHYVAHDNNRDSMAMALALSRNQMKTFLDFHPQVLHDLHESIPFLYISTGTGPYNAWVDPILINEWHLLAYNEVEAMTSRGVPGVWTHGFYDGWAPNYMFYVANGHNSIGRFYETFGNMVAETMDRNVGASATRNWFRPSPPLARVKWSLRNNINLQQSGLLFGLNFVAQNRERFLNNFYLKSKRSIAKAMTEGPAAWAILPGDRPTEAADLANLLRAQGVEIHVATSEIKIKPEEEPKKEGETTRQGEGERGRGGDKSANSENKSSGTEQNAAATKNVSLSPPLLLSPSVIPAGAYIVRMDQPYSRMADMLLDRQFYSPGDPQPYDDTGWTLGALRNLKTLRITDKDVLGAQMKPIFEDVRVAGGISGSANPAAFLINHTTENGIATLRFRLKDVKMEAAEEPFKESDASFNAGTVIIKSEEVNQRQKLVDSLKELGLKATGADKIPAVKMHPLSAPRIALVHTWTDTQDEGWFRIELDKLNIPYSYISVHTIRDTAYLRHKYDVLLFPPGSDSSQEALNGIPMRGEPLPWKGSAVTPNIGLSPDQTADMRGGLGLTGVANLRKFVEEGGLMIAVQGFTRTPIDFGLSTDVSVEEGKSLRTGGSIFNAAFSDRKSPIAYGYGETLPIYFRQGPLFRLAKLPGPDDDEIPGGGAGKPSGRGAAGDPDIIQGRTPLPALPKKQPGVEEEPTEEQRLFLGAYLTPKELRPRVVLRFAKAEKDLLISGMLTGGSELADRPAVIDCPLGKGHIVLFANNPMWRHTTQGSFFLLFNAIMNFDHLDAGRTPPPPSGRRRRGGADE